MGKPSIAISAAFCCALAAMALIKVKTMLKPMPPTTTMPVNRKVLLTGLFKKMKKRTRLITLIKIISVILYNNLLIINSTGDVME